MTYAATVANNGPGDATGVTLTIALGVDAVVTGLPAPGACGNVGSTITCGPATIPSGQHLDFSITVMPTTAGTMTATFTTAGTQNDPSPGNNLAASRRGAVDPGNPG